MEQTARRLERHLSIAEACGFTSFSRTTIKDALRRRELGFRRFGPSRRARVLIPESELAAWLERRGTFFPSDVDGAPRK